MKRYFKLMALPFYRLNAYRIDLLMRYLVLIIGLLTQVYLWKAIFNHGEVIANYTFNQIIVYVLFARIVSLLVNNDTDMDMARNIRTGDIITRLVRPVNLLFYYTSLAISNSLLNLLFITAPFIIYTIFAYSVKFTLIQVISILVSLFLAIVLSVAINFVIGVTCFYVKNIDALIWGKVFLLNVFSGFLIPITFFPEGVRTIVQLLPFKGVGYIPIQIILGKIRGISIIEQISFQLIWVVVLFVLGNMWLKVVRKGTTIQGG